MKTIAITTLFSALAIQGALAESSPLMGKTFTAGSLGQQPVLNMENAKGPLVTPAEPYEEDAPQEVLVKKALESAQATQVYNQVMESLGNTIREGGEVPLEVFRTSLRDALNNFFFGS
ncbi:hypothetical protein [Roseibacillus ishigakijimensis]|uniref:Killing trait domain-containing protein n=1 Tax=Roseibacillus ishigakijimensis TaxID=454146 RepID=A0A934RKZ9_9BACT|nr:hypothetical protein [Roseibacillus ishigakijimensis]MBK1833647.1 hypothetical protein [Roseibacillus ishigakijimensis]